jgi:predicted nuclease of restriction endonuclease-like (RecB) superfamily
VEKQKTAGWGDAVVARLASDLRDAFPGMRGFSADNLWRMGRFFTEYSGTYFLEQLVPESKSRGAVSSKKGRAASNSPANAGRYFLEQPVPESISPARHGPLLDKLPQEILARVPWGHHVELLKKVKLPAARLYYLRATARLGWSRSVLLNQIKGRAYERAVREKKTHNFPSALPVHLAEQAGEMIKSSYNLDFLGLGRAMRERELEDRLVGRLQQFILELGYGFCFVGRQHRLVLGAKEYFVDLLFYHRFLKALVAFDLKVGPFQPEHAGKMDFYLNLLNEKERAPDDQPSIGIILCAEKDDIEVEFALKSKTNPIGVAEYELQAKLPPQLKGRLPTARQLSDALRNVTS